MFGCSLQLFCPIRLGREKHVVKDGLMSAEVVPTRPGEVLVVVLGPPPEE